MNERDQPDDAATCTRCGGELKLVTRLSRLTPDPAYWIYRCIVCGLIEWLAEQTEPPR
jgi:DNA-directed RNA polymerase subunit RPC12/RpoP